MFIVSTQYSTGDVQRLALQPATAPPRSVRNAAPAPTGRALAFDVRPSAYAIEILMLLSALSIFAMIDLARAWL